MNSWKINTAKVNVYVAYIYSGLTVISGVMLPNFCNTDSVYTAGATSLTYRHIVRLTYSTHDTCTYRIMRALAIARRRTRLLQITQW